jgi:hypothetical protein
MKSPIAKALEQQRVIAERNKLTLPEAQAELGGLAAAHLLRHGLSGNQVSHIRLMPEHMLKALRVAPAKSTLLGEGGHADDIVEKLAGMIRLRLRGVRLVLAIDGSATRFAGGGKITIVTAESAELDHPLVLLVDIEQEGACDAEYYCRCLKECMKSFELTSEQIIGVATDNAAVMPKSVKLAELLPLPCAAHLLNLMLKAFAETMDFSDLFGWRLFVDDASRRTDMAQAGLRPGSFNSVVFYFILILLLFAKKKYTTVPAHRFAHALPALAELAARWNEYGAFLVNYPLPKSTVDRAYMQSLKAHMSDPKSRAIVVIANELCEPADKLIKDASLEARLVPADFWTRFFAWITLLRSSYNVGQQYIDGITHVIPGVTPAIRAQLVDTLENAIACAIDKPTRHVLAETPAADDALPGDTLARADRLRSELSIFLSRECFNIGQPGVLPPRNNDAAIWSWAVKATNSLVPPAAFRSALNTFLEKKEANLLPLPVPPPPASPFTKANADALVAFWRGIAKDPVLAPVGEAALRALSVAVSQTVVERQFSVLSNLEIDNRLHGSIRYVRNMLMLRCNGPYFDEYAASRLTVVGPATL